MENKEINSTMRTTTTLYLRKKSFMSIFLNKQDLNDDIRKAQGKYTADEIVSICKKSIKKNGQVKIFEEFYNPLIKDNVELAISILSGNDKYMLDKLPSGSWIMRKNPHHKTMWHELKVACITGLVTLIAGIILWLIDNRSKNQEMRFIKNRLEKIEKTMK